MLYSFIIILSFYMFYFISLSLNLNINSKYFIIVRNVTLKNRPKKKYIICKFKLTINKILVIKYKYNKPRIKEIKGI